MSAVPIVVYEPFRSIFYAPQFVALHGGHFAAEGLDVEVRTAGGGVAGRGIAGPAQAPSGSARPAIIPKRRYSIMFRGSPCPDAACGRP